MADADEAVSKMRVAVADGTLRLDPGTASACAAECDAVAVAVARQIADLQQVAFMEGFGGFLTSEQLQSGFERKAAAAITHLKSYADIATGMADNFRAIEARYAEQEDANSATIAAAGNGVSINGGQ